MNNSFAGFKALVTFAILLPVAIILGYTLSNPLSYSTFATIGIVLGVMTFPFFLKWHQPMLILCWNLAAIIPFIKGQPRIGLVVAALAFSLALFERALDRNMRFVQVWQVTTPLFLLALVVLLTSGLTGGIGLRTFGSEVYGGKKYVFLLASIAAYFALTAWQIPAAKGKFYVGLFFLGSVFGFVSDLYPFFPSWLEFTAWFFPPTGYVSTETLANGVARFPGIATAGEALFFLMIMRYGLRGIFLSGKLWRPVLLTLFFSTVFVGGFRSMILLSIIVCIVQFFLEGLHRTRLMPLFVGVGMLCAVLLIPFASKLPFTFQRALAFLPLDISTAARFDAQQSSQWRIDIWEALLPQVPQYFWLGKGYAIHQEDYQMMGLDTSFRAIDASDRGLALAGDYHNGPLSVILPFGVWGGLAFLWFLWAGGRVLYFNYRYGDPTLKLVNTFLLTLFICRTMVFLFVYGALNTDIWRFAGTVGLSVALNNGMCRKVARLNEETIESNPRPVLLRARPSFQR